MFEWNAVISVNERGFKKAFEVLGAFGEVRRTEFFNVLVMKAYDVRDMLEKLRELSERQPDSLAFLARLVPVDRAFLFRSREEFEERAKEGVLDFARDVAGKSFHVRIRRRGFRGRITSPEEERLLDAVVLDAAGQIGSPARIDFETPDVIIGIETIGTRAGIAMIRRETSAHYPFVRI